MTSKDHKSPQKMKISRRVKTKKSLKGGNPKDFNHDNRRDLIEQAVSST